MADRLNELRRQRELVRQHLAWLDTEIARADDPAGPSAAAPTPAFIPGSTPATAVDEEALLARYQADAGDSSRRVKLGCWIAFCAAFAALALLVGAWYFLRAR